MVKLYKKLPIIIVLILTLNIKFLAKAEPANITVEGQGNHFVTGQSYPSKITFAGYDAVNNKIYLNYELTTTKSNSTNIEYYIEVFNNNSTLIGSLGSYSSPITSSLGGQTLTVTNKEIILTDALTTKYNIVITVKKVS